MPDKRKKKTREDAIELLKQKAANNGLKNQAQQGARNAKLNTTTTKDNVSTTTSQTGKPSTEAKKSATGTLTGSQSPSVARRSPSLSDISRRRDFVTTERAKRTQTTTPTRRTSSVQNAEDRRSGRYRNDRREKQSYINTPRNRVQYDRNKTTVGDRIADTLKGSVKQWAGGNVSAVGTAAQFAEPTVRGIQKTEYRDPRDTSYSLRSREEAERTNLNRQANIGVKEGRDLRTFKGREYSDKNANLQAFIHSADNLIESGSRDIERAKKGTGKIGSFAIDTLSNMAQMGGDLASNVALPGLGMVALGVRSAGMGSYQARQNGLDVNEQALHGMIDGIVEMGSEAIFGGVSALQKTYGKGMFSLADKLGWRTASSDMVRRMFKTDFGQALATHLGRLGAGMLEEGTEELVADVFEPALKYVFTKASDPTYQFEGIDLKQMGYDFLLGAMTAGVLGGGSTVSGIRADSQAFVDGQNYVQDLVNNARVQGRMGEATSNAEILADRLQAQMDRGVTASPYQIRTLQEALGESRETNARAFERRGTEETERAIQEGRLRESTGTRAELNAFDRGVEAVEQRNTERARQTMGADSSEISVGAVGRVLSGTADINDFETILTDKKAKDAVETLTGSKLAINNAEARGSLEDLTLMNEIANKDTIRKEAQAAHAEDIRAELTNMDKRGGDIFAKNYAEAVRTIGSGAVYEDVFTRLYADGTVKESSFEDSYNRIVLQNGGEVAQYFTEAKAREAFNAGRMAMISQNGQTTAKNMAEKASMNPAGISFEGNAKNLISSKQATALQKFAERSNVHIRVVETMSKTLDDGTVLSANGSYRDGTIYIAADASNKLVTVAKHEMTHHIKKMSPERYQELEDFVFRKWYENDATRMEDEIRKKQLLYGDISVEEAREEIIADASEAFFTDEGAIQEVCSFSKKLGRAIHDGIKTLLDTLLDLQDSDNLSKRGYGDFLDDIGILREAERMWLEALEDSRERSKGTAKGENIEALEGDNLFSIKEDEARWTEDRIDNLISEYGAPHDDRYSKAYAVLMNPRDFLKLTLSDESLDKWNASARNIPDKLKGKPYRENVKSVHDERLETGVWIHDNENYPIDYEELARQRQTPFLEISSSNGTMVDGHEGRHRMRALMEAGIKSVPVVIRDTDTKYTKDHVKGMSLSPQDFGRGAVNNGERIHVSDLVPIKESNRAELIEKFGGEADVKFSLKEQDQAYMDAVNKDDMETAQRLVEQAAERAGYIPEKRYHGSLNASFTIFDKGHAHVGGNSGAGFYFSNNEEDSDINYADVNGADNQTKIDALFEMILDYGEWNGIEPKTPQEAYELAKAEIEKKPGIYEVYLKYDNPYVRDYRNSTNIYDKIMEDFDESVVDRDDYDNDDDYEDDLMNYREEHLFNAIDQAVLGAYSDIEDNYEVVDWPALSDISQALFEEAYEYGLTWSNITDVLDNLSMGSEFVLTNDGWGYEPDGSREFARAIIENFGYDAIIDKEAGTKFNQLKGRGMTDTEHTIVFHPNQIKSADAITRDDDGNVIPLSQRFNPESNDIRFSIKEKNEIENIGAAVTDGGTVAKYSLKSWAETDVAKLRQKLIDAGFEASVVDKWIKDVNSTASVLMANHLDYIADRSHNALKPNSEYFFTLDLSTLCAKRRLYQGTYNAIMHRMKNAVLLPKDAIHLRALMSKDYEVPCGICYEESRKKNEAKFANQWLNGKKTKNNPWPGYANMKHDDPYIPTLDDVLTTDGRSMLQAQHPEVLESYLDFQKKRGSANPKVSLLHTDYRSEILNMTPSQIKNVKDIGGLRIQSFSDFELPHVLDMMQAVLDMSAMKLTSQAYTKVPAFAEIFGGTGIKINLSLIGEVKNGKLVFDDKEGINSKEAFKLRDKYSKNVGTIIVGANPESVLAAWKDKRIDMVIPFHRSGWSKAEFEALGLGTYTDFQKYQSERYLDGSKNGITLAEAAKRGLIPKEDAEELFATTTNEHLKYWDPTKTGKENAELYLKKCAELHRRPVFYELLQDNGDGTWSLKPDGSTDGYWKSLIDFKMYDNEGNFAPQQEVKPIFNMTAAKRLINKYEGDPDTLPVADKVVDQFIKDYEGGRKYRLADDQKVLDKDLPKIDKNTKYQLKDSDSKDTIASQNTIAKLENQVKDLKAEFKRTDLKTANQKDVRIQAGKLIKRHDSNMGVQKDLVDTFNKIFRLYKENGEKAFDEVYEIAKDEAVNIVNGIGIIHDEGAEEYKAIKDYLRTTPITISEDMKKNITDFNDFRKRYFGKIKLVNGETSNIDNVYMELAEMFPEQFTDDYVNPHDQLNHIVDVLDNYAPYYETLDGASEEMQDYVVEIAGDIMETAYNLQTKKTFADKKYEEKIKAVQKAREKALESRDKALERQRTRYEKKIDDMKAHQKEIRENRKARREDSEARTKLLKIARRLDKLKTTAENRAQIDALIGDLDLVAKGMTDKSLEKLTDIQSWYNDRAQNDPDFIPDSNIENKLKRLSKTHIKDMTIEEVRDLYDVLSNIENEIATEKKLIDSEVKKEIYEAGRETIKNINKSHGLANSIRKLDTFFVSGTLSPLRQIRRVTGYNDSDPLYIATKELADGQRKMLQYQMDSWKAFDRFMNDKKFIDSLNGKKAEEIEVTGMKDGEPFDVKITPDIRMAMYLAGMNEDNLRHMMYGGITLPDIKLYKKGKIAEAMESGETVRFSPSQIKEITSHMSKREKEFAQEAYKYYNITSPQAINEVSEVLKGYSLARVNNYFPIHTDSDFLTKEFESMKFDGTIEGMGFLKERVKASNPILMTGLVDTLTKSIEMNSKYVGLAIPVRNFSKILNVKDMSWDEEGNAEFRGAVKRSISKKWGKSVLNYIEKFMTDLQNGRKSSDEWGSVFSKARSRYAGAVLTLNASVAIKQAASYPTAAAVLGWAPLAKAMGNVGKVDLDLIAKYTPLQWYRSKGYSTTELGDITSSRTGNIPTPLNWIQGMDLLTTRKLWKASEYYVRQHNKSLKAGTDEYYKAVAEIYNKVIEETQPNYTTMQRPGLLRSDNEITLTLNMFKTQPYQNFNILFDAFGNYTAKRNQYKANGNSESKKALKEAGRDMQNAVTSQIAQLAVFAAMTSLWALFRRKDDKYRDEEGKLTIFSYMKKLGEDMISNLFAAVPLGADVYSMASSIFTGDTYYGFTSVTDSAITDVMDSFKNGAVAIGDWIEYGRSDNPEKKPSSDMYKETENVISSASRAMGIPASNLRNLVNGIYGWVAISADGEYIGTYEAQKMTFAKGKEMKQNLFRAYQNDKAAYEELRKMMIEDGFDEAKLDDYIKDQRKEHHTEEEQKEIDSTMQELEGSKIWKDATEDEKKDFTNRVTNIALGITNTDTESISKYVTGGLTEEQVILYKLALKKANRENDNNTSYNNDEKEAALRMLEQNYKLTQQQKDILKGKKS